MSVAAPPAPAPPAASLAERFAGVRAQTERLCEGLVTEDYVVQSMEDVSPAKWHLAHTTWFWETFVLTPHADGYALYDDRYPFLFNSYYVQAGERHCRAQRGYLSRPTVEEVFSYRRHVTEAMGRLLGAGGADSDAVADVVEVGLHHEQQHQELMVTDLKHVFSVNPLRPALRERERGGVASDGPGPLGWRAFDAGLHELGRPPGGATAAERFHFDNEGPRHRAFVEGFEIGDRLVTCGEFLEFVADGGYATAPLWLSLGWAEREARGWSEPFYWERDTDSPTGYAHYTLAGMRPVDADEPVTHLTYFEADAYARWAGARLPSEAEWEVAARSVWDGEGLAPAPAGAFVEGGRFHPAPAAPPAGGDGAPSERGGVALRQMFGVVWQWTHSQYGPYPGYRPVEGALGEYNGKFMANQFVLRGGSVATPRAHIRPTYRNFFPPEAAWQFTGLRLARSA